MRKLIVAVAAIAVVVVAAPVGASMARTVEAPYSGANGARTTNSEAHWSVGVEELRFQAKPGERTVMLTIQDESGQTAFGHVHVYDRDHEIVENWGFCNAMEAPMTIPAGALVGVELMAGTCDDGTTPAVVTTGVVTATFAR